LVDERYILRSGLLKYNIDPKDKMIDDFIKYMKLLIERNKLYNLTKITEPREIVVEHFLDSLSALKLDIIKGEMKVIDVGTGAGFPGIPLKLVIPEIEITLIDASKKRINFVRHVIEMLEMEGATAIQERAEILGRDEKYREKYDIIVSRAVAQIRVLCEYCLPLLNLSGVFLAYKGPGIKEEIKDSDNAVEILGGEIKGIETLEVPYSNKTHNIVIIKKIKETPKEYPRSAKKIKKSPL